MQIRVICVCDLGILTGSRDKTIKLWVEGDDGEYTEASMFVGHTDFVSALAFAPASSIHPDGLVVSGARDATVRLWNPVRFTELQILEGHKYQVGGGKMGVCQQVLTGHTGPVLCTLRVPRGDVWSGSGDDSIRVWREGTCVDVIPAHADTVRHLAFVPGSGQAVSASHDTTLKVWDVEARACTSQLWGHSSLVYAAAATPGGLLASGSEDNTSRLWHLGGGPSLQTLPHPGCVWTVDFLPDSDLVTGCADGVARLFTQDSSRAAGAEAVQVFEATLAAAAEVAAAKEGAGEGGAAAGLKLEDPSVLREPGTHPGQTRVVREGGTGMAYSWNAASQSWDVVGEVVGGPGGGEDTLAPAGSRVVGGRTWDYVFDVDVEDGSPPRRLPVDAGENPYVAADRFLAAEDLPTSYREQIVSFILQNTPSGQSLPGASSGHAGDPFTGANAYVPGAPSAAPPMRPSPGLTSVVGGGPDPFTGSAATPGLIPAARYLVFDALPDPAAVARKLGQLAPGVPAPVDAARVEALAAALCAPTAAAPSAAQAETLAQLLAYPAAALFPALDLARRDAPAPTRLTAARLVANLYAEPETREWARAGGAALTAALATALPPETKAARHALVTALHNAVLALVAADVAGGAEILSAASDVLLSTPGEESETRVRGLVALGTLLHTVRPLRGGARGLGLEEVAAQLGGEGGDVGQAARELRAMLAR
ncbi:Phospholipase A-2-activating protein [Auxenochlorella protothecoides]|uniref:Phospholipase A-2-activating protein n=1 Tax=Auxenochlorella protothecoides TaxID=3075 RepID=A0A087SP87_AUXPR|nr:Phospholipase A-2-activating protein [Auxenochlorella protothecoides]KFM27541.1 Phospholipase A-2-activating protein [Auxenochlorella protothecoides]